MSPLNRLNRALDRAAMAINEAHALAQQVTPGATLYLEAEGYLYAMDPEPESHKQRDTNTAERQSLVFARSYIVARCDVGAW